MSKTRRDFLRSGAAVAAATIAGPRLLDALEAPSRIITARYLPPPGTEAFNAELAAEALNAARDAGATYADVRIGRYRRQFIATRERQITGVNDGESYGVGIRTIVNGAWGFAATSNMTKDGVAKAAREAARLSRAARSVQKRPIELAPTPVIKGTWMTPVTRDPLEVPIDDKFDLLFDMYE